MFNISLSAEYKSNCYVTDIPSDSSPWRDPTPVWRHPSLVVFAYTPNVTTLAIPLILRRAGTNLKVGGHNRPARSAGEKFLGVPLHFSAVPLQLGGHFKQWRGGAMASGARLLLAFAAHITGKCFISFISLLNTISVNSSDQFF